MPHILIVDDENLIAHLLRRSLEANGFRVSIAVDGYSALETARTTIIDGVITDLRMPGINGQELLDQLRKKQSALPAIILSGYTKNFTWKMDDQTTLLSKPVEPEQLVESLHQLLGHGVSARSAMRRKMAA